MSTPSQPKETRVYVFLDCEFPDVKSDSPHIAEFAMIPTDAATLNHDFGTFECVVDLTGEADSAASDWSTKNNGQLMRECKGQRSGAKLLSYAEAEKAALNLLDRVQEHYGKHILVEFQAAGYSVQRDMNVIAKRMPKLHERFHYRQFNVTVLVQTVREGWCVQPMMPVKSETHRAMSDAKQSLDMARFWRQWMVAMSTFVQMFVQTFPASSLHAK